MRKDTKIFLMKAFRLSPFFLVNGFDLLFWQYSVRPDPVKALIDLPVVSSGWF